MGGISRKKRKVIKVIAKVIDKVLKSNLYWNYVFKVNGYHDTGYTFQNTEIAFVHVPKTGGTSFYKMLEGINHNIINVKIHKPVSSKCPPEEFNYVTIIRNPIDRVWSLYNMVLRSPANYPYKNFANDGLEQFLKKCWEARDMYCRYFSNKVVNEVNAQTFLLAQMNLSAFYAVIDFDNFSDEVLSFFHKENIKVDKILHERKANNATMQEQDKLLIEKYNSFDLKLYEDWKMKFH